MRCELRLFALAGTTLLFIACSAIPYTRFSGSNSIGRTIDGTEHRTGQDSVETFPNPGRNTTLVKLDAGTKYTPFDKMIIEKEKTVLDLTAKGDYENWARLLADDAVAVYDTGYASKGDVLKALNGMTDIHCSMDQVKVMRVGKTAALIIYRMTQDWKEQGKPMTRQYYISSLWVKRRGKWLSQFWQETDSTLPDDDLSTQALAKEHEILGTLNRNDWTAFASLLADDLVAIDEDGIHSKKELLEQISAAEVRFSDFKMEDVKVIPQGNGAIVVYKETLVGTEHGKPFTRHIYTHSHWERRGGQWLMTMFQDSTANQDTQATSSQTLPDQKEIENQIIALEKRLWNGDANEISKLEAEDYEVIKHAHRYHRADDEAAAKDVKFALTSMDDIRVRMLRPDVALITYHATQKGSFRGTEVPPSLYFGSIWVNRSGDWKNVFLEENAPDVFTDIYMPSADRAQRQDRSEFWCANEQYLLLDGSADVTWNSEDCSAYLNGLVGLWNRWN